MDLNRRDFLKGAAAAGLAAGGAAILAGCSSASGSTSGTAASANTTVASQITWDDEADVIVLGCGAGGAPAAVEAGRAGVDTLIIEKMDWLGGCMRRCGGGLIGCNTKVQQKLGVVDPGPDTLYNYMAACTEGNYDADLLRTFVDNCGPATDWVITPVDEGGMGGEPLDEWEFATADDGMTGLVSPGLSIGSPTAMYWEQFGFDANIEKRRVHWFKPNEDDIDPGDRHYAAYTGTDFGSGHGSKGGGGTGLWKPFEDVLTSMDNVRIQMETTIKSLVKNDAGEIIGVVVAPTDGGDDEYIKAKKGVIIATGTYVVDKEMYENFTGKKWTYEEDPKSVVNGSPYNDYQADGAGIKAALAAGTAPRYILEGNSGGLRINSNSEAIDTNGNVIPRLYITSRAVGGLFKEKYYPQCGVFVTSGIVFGRIAGKNAAALESWA